MLKMRTLVPSLRFTIWRVASMPFSSGSDTSITTTWGRRRSVISAAVRPSRASPTTWMSASASRMRRRPWRTTVWSSTSRTRSLTVRGSSRHRSPVKENRSGGACRARRGLLMEHGQPLVAALDPHGGGMDRGRDRISLVGTVLGEFVGEDADVLGRLHQLDVVEGVVLQLGVGHRLRLGRLARHAPGIDPQEIVGQVVVEGRGVLLLEGLEGPLLVRDEGLLERGFLRRIGRATGTRWSDDREHREHERDDEPETQHASSSPDLERRARVPPGLPGCQVTRPKRCYGSSRWPRPETS